MLVAIFGETMQGSTFIALQLEEKGHPQKVHILCMDSWLLAI